MYRDDPLDDEAELRAVVGDEPVDALLAAGPATLEVALDVLRLLQGWVDDERAARWLCGPQRRLADRAPLEALAAGAHDEVEDAARAWVAANG